MQAFLLVFLGGAIFTFALGCIFDAWEHFVGHNPAAPSAWARLKAWWPGFVKRHIVDDNPYDDESHAKTRYRDLP